MDASYRKIDGRGSNFKFLNIEKEMSREGWRESCS